MIDGNEFEAIVQCPKCECEIVVNGYSPAGDIEMRDSDAISADCPFCWLKKEIASMTPFIATGERDARAQRNN